MDGMKILKAEDLQDRISIKTALKYVPENSIPGDKPMPEALRTSPSVHMCVTRLQLVNYTWCAVFYGDLMCFCSTAFHILGLVQYRGNFPGTWTPMIQIRPRDSLNCIIGICLPIRRNLHTETVPRANCLTSLIYIEIRDVFHKSVWRTSLYKKQEHWHSL